MRVAALWARIRPYPSAVAGAAIILALVLVAVVTVIAIPYNQAVTQWRGGDADWRMNPVNASPVWTNRLTGGNAPRTMRVTVDPDTIQRAPFEGGLQMRLPLSFDFPYDDFPSELTLMLTLSGTERAAFVDPVWQRPDGSEIRLGAQRITGADRIALSQDRALEGRLGDVPHVALFAQAQDRTRVVQGRYTLLIDAVLFDEGAELSAELLAFGRVHGLAGTDHLRRDLMLALLWGTPIALAFGILAAVGTTVTTLVIAAVGVWFGGLIDAVIQRLTEVTMILPILPILVMIGTLYSTSIWLMLGVVIALGIFSASIKMYRAMLLPLRRAPYIEAARAYGASNMRIVIRYMIPRILPVLIPSFVTLIPTYVFLEASLAVLGLGDPVLPTWGKVLNDAQTQGALFNGFYYWVIAPAVLLMLTGLGFALFGFALDRIFNPRLRST
ncbi:MAG: ABC transporter permease [Rhodobacteraceae bacterium]|nr:MAG: ABC transporter permease [Paracoccaceae bacterium]